MKSYAQRIDKDKPGSQSMQLNSKPKDRLADRFTFHNGPLEAKDDENVSLSEDDM